ncbi:TPA: hypothetical protein K8N02_000268 [Clostridium perfringens]|nr:hypothetical protein [Clostridium perfringens]
MITIKELKEMGKFEFASFVLTLTILDIVKILEEANIFIKKNEKKDIALKILFDVIEGVRISTEEDIKKLATRKKMAETKKLNKENEKKRELELESIWKKELNQEDKSLIYLYYCFENGIKINPIIPMYDLVKDKLPYGFMKDVKDLMSFYEFEFDDFKGFKKYIKYVHPDTHINYKTNEFADLSKYTSEYLKLFRVGNN